jgi:predicted nucleic acid-binding protein
MSGFERLSSRHQRRFYAGAVKEAEALAAGHAPGMADAVVAGIAAAHELFVVTRDTKHFLPFGVAVLSPDEAAAEGDRA